MKSNRLSPNPGLRSAKPRIVVVDDEPHLLEMVEQFIRHNFKNVTLQIYQDGKEAWEDILRAEPDLLISDLYRKVTDGFELLRLLKEKQAQFPILITSGMWGNEATRVRAKACAGDLLQVTFWKKPYASQPLIRYILEQLGPVSMTPNAG
jgi:DNA-binding response OmpR family regulator